jgi:hypothetical protein
LNGSLVLQSLKLLRSVVNDAPTIGYQDSAQWKTYASWLVRSRLLAGRVDSAGAFSNQFLNPGVKS